MKMQLRTIGVVFIILMAAWGSAQAQVVDIPDQQLRVAAYDALGIPTDASVTRADMLQLTGLDVTDRGIENLSGLEFSTNLTWLALGYNPITDLRPIAGLTKLDTLYMWATSVSDITPLANLTNLRFFHANYSDIADIHPVANLVKLEELALAGNGITDITPLANLVKLEVLDLAGNGITDIAPLTNLLKLDKLYLQDNQIVDVRPLAGLTSLTVLAVENNFIMDHSPLDGLALTVFEYDNYQSCDMPPLPLQERLENRSFPSVFSAWGGLGWSSVINQPHLSDLEQMTQHDLYFCCLMFAQEFVKVDGIWEIHDLRDTQGWIEDPTEERDKFIAHNPNMIFLASFSWLFVDLDTYPPDSPYWMRDANGDIAIDYGVGTVDITHPDVQQEIIQKTVAIDTCGLYDGVFFDFWGEYGHSSANVDAMVAIVKGIRQHTRENFLIMGNSNDRTAPKTGAYINGLFMETATPFGDYKHGGDEQIEAGLMQIEATLRWGADHLRSPQIIGLEAVGFTDNDEPLDSHRNLRWMRAITALSLTFSDGYVLYITRFLDGQHMHWHYWYDFWDADLGRPVGEKFQLYDAHPGLYIREFTNSWAVYNHSGKAQIITLPEEVQAVASGLVNTEHALPNLDGEMYLRIKPKNPADVNDDGVVNIFDLTIVAQAIGTDDRQGDVNGDGRINVFDLVLVANAF